MVGLPNFLSQQSGNAHCAGAAEWSIQCLGGRFTEGVRLFLIGNARQIFANRPYANCRRILLIVFGFIACANPILTCCQHIGPATGHEFVVEEFNKFVVRAQNYPQGRFALRNRPFGILFRSVKAVRECQQNGSLTGGIGPDKNVNPLVKLELDWFGEGRYSTEIHSHQVHINSPSAKGIVCLSVRIEKESCQ